MKICIKYAIPQYQVRYEHVRHKMAVDICIIAAFLTHINQAANF